MIEKFSYRSDSLRTILLAYGQYVPTRHEFLSTEFSTITNSSQEVGENSLFVPLIAGRDGHDFILSALENGASGFLCNADHPIWDQLPIEAKSRAIPVVNTWVALGQLANYHRRLSTATVIAITGSSGKTTTKELLGTCLSHIDPEELVVTEKNYNNEIGVPFTLFRLTPKTRFAVIEMGMNHRGEIARLSEIAEPNHCLVTNIGSAHIEHLRTPEEIAWEKTDIVTGMRGEGNLYLPSDVAFPEIALENARKKNRIPIFWQIPSLPAGPSAPANTGSANSDTMQLHVVKVSPQGFRLKWQGFEFDWNHPGVKILSNLAGVFRVATDLGIQPEQIVNNIQSYQPQGSRLKIREGRFIILDDCYNANPESMESSLNVAKQLSDGKPFYAILGDMKELGDYSEYYHRKTGEIAADLGISGLVSYGMDSQWITESLNESPQKPAYLKSAHFPSESGGLPSNELAVEKIANWVGKNVDPGAVLLVKGSRSMKMESIVEKILEISKTP